MKHLLVALLLAASVASAQGAASHGDSAVLSTDTTYQNRVQESLLQYCVQTVVSEGFSVLWHKQRADLCEKAVVAPATYKTLFAATTATDTTILADATVGGTVPLTVGNVAAQALLVTDGHIDNAVAAEFNTFLNVP
jgi:hypothetical protein